MKKTKIITIISTLLIATAAFSQQIGNGRSLEINDFTVPLNAGLYEARNPVGTIPDLSYAGYQHLFVIRHSNDLNNHELQIASSFSDNDRLFFRKSASYELSPINPVWNELATRGTNDFIGDQSIIGNVGIGTKKPIEKLDVNGGTGDGVLFDAKIALTKVSSTGNVQSAKIVLSDDDTNWANLSFKVKTTASKSELESFYTDALTIKGSNANVGIGTKNPIEKFNIHGGTGDGTPFEARMALTKVSSVGNVQSAKIVLSDDDINFSNLTFKVKTTASKSELESFYTDALTIKGSNANVGIGTTNPKNKLDVNGTIHSKEVKVDMNGWSDFVFKKDYVLPTLEEVEIHITEKGHLENIPSEKEVLQNGINLGEMNAKLLQKIEELTLYMIEMKKENEEQNKKIRILENKIISQK